MIEEHIKLSNRTDEGPLVALKEAYFDTTYFLNMILTIFFHMDSLPARDIAQTSFTFMRNFWKKNRVQDSLLYTSTDTLSYVIFTI